MQHTGDTDLSQAVKVCWLRIKAVFKYSEPPPPPPLTPLHGHRQPLVLVADPGFQNREPYIFFSIFWPFNEKRIGYKNTPRAHFNGIRLQHIRRKYCTIEMGVLEVLPIIFLWKYSDDSLIRTRLFPVDISGLTSFPDYWIAYQSRNGNRFPHFFVQISEIFWIIGARINESSL